MLWLIIIVALLAGLLGGAVGALIAEGTHPPKRKRIHLNPFIFRNGECGKIFTTMLGNILFGGLSALLFWGIYGPLKAVPLIGSTYVVSDFHPLILSIGDVVALFLVGTGGPTFLLAEARRRCEGKNNKAQRSSWTSQNLD